MPEIIFSKKDFQTRHWNHLHFGPNFVILGTALGCFSQFCFKKKFLPSVNHGGHHFCSTLLIIS